MHINFRRAIIYHFMYRGKQDLGVICKVALESCQIAHFGAEGELFALAPNIEELNLGYNLLYSWSEVLRMLSGRMCLNIFTSCVGLEIGSSIAKVGTALS
jgi:hypothetical protein